MKNVITKMGAVFAIATTLSLMPTSVVNAQPTYGTVSFNSANARDNFCQQNNCIGTYEIPYHYVGPRIIYYAVYTL